MAIRILRVRITRSELHTLEVDVPAWEAPILEAMHQAASVVGESIATKREAPEVQDEYLRLENRYRRQTEEDGSQGLPWVAAVYGQHQVGYSNLRKEIEMATVDVVAEPELPDDIAALLG